MQRPSAAGPCNKKGPIALIVAGLLLIVLSMVLPAWRIGAHHARVSLAIRECRQLSQACALYFSEYGTWPTTSMGRLQDYTQGGSQGNAAVLNVLRSVEGHGNEAHALNIRRIVYLPASVLRRHFSGQHSSQDMLDPWQMPYYFTFDTDLNDRCELPDSPFGPSIARGVVVWSSGPDRVPHTRDDLGLSSRR